jgi:arylsulfatase A-like enzyme
MQSLADDGIVFANAIGNCNWTRPAIASIFTSLLPESHGILRHSHAIPKDYKLLADELSNHSYYTVGISTNPNIKRVTGFARGFNEFYYLGGIKQAIPLDLEAPPLTHFETAEYLLPKLMLSLNHRKVMFSDAERTTDRTISILNRMSDRRFFVYLHYMDPHDPYYHHPYNGQYGRPYGEDPAEENLELYSALYKGEITYFDKHLNRLLEYLKETGIYDSTLIILTADHGEEFYDHYGWQHGINMYDELIHNPLIIKLPSSAKAGTIDSTLVEQIDYAPTILEYLGFEPPDTWQGQYIFDPDYSNEYVVSQAENGCYGEHEYVIHSVRTLEHKWMVVDSGYHPDYIMTYQGAYVDERGIFDEKNLFDLIKDAAEKNNLYGVPEYQPIVDTMLYRDSTIQALMDSLSVFQDTVPMDQKTIQQLREIGYLQ